MKTVFTAVFAIFLFTAAMVWTGYQTGDPDSQFYVFLTRQQSLRELSELMAPYWLGEQGIRPDAYVKDHLIGQVALGVSFAKLGIPPTASLYVACFICVLLSFLLIHRLLLRFVSAPEALLGTLLTLIFPISFLYRIRANHEQPLFLLCLAAIWAGLSLKTNHMRALVVSALTVCLFLIKGFVFVVVPYLFVIALFLSGQLGFKRWLGVSFLCGVSALASTGLVGLAYEELFRRITGEVFFSEYFRIQLVERSIQDTLGEAPYLFRRFYAWGYYFVQALWYGVPVTLPVLWIAWKAWTSRKSSRDSTAEANPPHGAESKLQRLRHATQHGLRSLWNAETLFPQWSSQKRGAVVFLTCGLAYVFALSLSDRVSGRYVFPAFYFLPLGLFLLCAPQFLRRLPTKARAFFSSTEQPSQARQVIVLALLVLTLLHVFTTNKTRLIPLPEELPFEPLPTESD